MIVADQGWSVHATVHLSLLYELSRNIEQTCENNTRRSRLQRIHQRNVRPPQRFCERGSIGRSDARRGYVRYSVSVIVCERLRKCVHCGFCTATCPTYQVLGDDLDSPRGRIYLMKRRGWSAFILFS